MADLTDVSNTLVGLVASTVYPSGTAQPSAIGAQCRVGAGWPTSAQLDPDLANGIVNVSVAPANIERRTTRYMPSWQTIAESSPTVALTVAGNAVTVGGVLPSPVSQNVAIDVVGIGTFAYAVQPTDTATTVATALASLISAALPGTTSSGPTVTVLGVHTLTARVGAAATVGLETRRQLRVFRVIVWASTPTQRDVTAELIDVMLSQLDFIVMPDGFAARLLYHSSNVIDMQERADLYRRDLMYSVEYATTVEQQAPTVLAPQINPGTPPANWPPTGMVPIPSITP